MFNHPELLGGAALAAGNFRFRGVNVISKSPAAAKFPILGIQGDRDPYLDALTNQWNDAVKLARTNGYPEPTRTMVPGAGHQAFPEQVLDYFASLLPSGK